MPIMIVSEMTARISDSFLASGKLNLRQGDILVDTLIMGNKERVASGNVSRGRKGRNRSR
jgi:hypothetical protein